MSGFKGFALENTGGDLDTSVDLLMWFDWLNYIIFWFRNLVMKEIQLINLDIHTY